jgi:hypothetical protein
MFKLPLDYGDLREPFGYFAAGEAPTFPLAKKDVPHNISVGVDYLKARYAEGGVWVWYNIEGRNRWSATH